MSGAAGERHDVTQRGEYEAFYEQVQNLLTTPCNWRWGQNRPDDRAYRTSFVPVDRRLGLRRGVPHPAASRPECRFNGCVGNCSGVTRLPAQGSGVIGGDHLRGARPAEQRSSHCHGGRTSAGALIIAGRVSMNLLAPVALWGFWILLGAGWILGELRSKGIAISVLLWLVGFAGSSFVVNGMLFTPYIAILDIGLVFVIFKGDVRLR